MRPIITRERRLPPETIPGIKPVSPLSGEQRDEDELYKILEERKAKAEAKLLRNTLVQLALVVIGGVYLFQLNGFLAAIFSEMGKEKDFAFNAARPVSLLLIPPVLLYLFIELGFALGQYLVLYSFFSARYETMAARFRSTHPRYTQGQITMALHSLNIFSQLAGNSTPQGKVQTIIARSMVGLLILANHVVMFAILELVLADHETMLKWLKLAAGAVLLVFYLLYLTSSRENKFSPTWPTLLICALSGTIIFCSLASEFGVTRRWIDLLPARQQVGQTSASPAGVPVEKADNKLVHPVNDGGNDQEKQQ